MNKYSFKDKILTPKQFFLFNTQMKINWFGYENKYLYSSKNFNCKLGIVKIGYPKTKKNNINLT